MTRRSGLLIAAVALAVAAVPVTAHAAQPLKLKAPGYMLARSDVPAALGKPKAGKNAYSVEFGGAGGNGNFSLCVATSGQPELTVPAASGWQTTVKLAGKGYREVSEWLSTFGNTAAGEANFGELQREAAKCNGTTTSPISNDSSHPVDGNYVSTSTSGTIGDDVVWVSVDTKVKSKNPKVNGSVTTTYTVFRNSMNVILQTQLFLNGTETTTAKQRAAVDRLSLQLMNQLPQA